MRAAISQLVDEKDLDRGLTENVMKEIMSGEATDAQIGSFLTALNIKSETAEEIAACARVMRKFAKNINPSVDQAIVDTCGTGGDNLNTFNISTTSMFVASGAGVPIAKHGNRSVTSRSGSADVLEQLGVNIDLSPKTVEKSIENIGIGFMFAPRFHEAMKHVIGPRKEIEIRSVFNVLGPLTNPAGTEAQVMGVYGGDLTEKLAKVLKKLGCERALVIHGEDGLDEISTLDRTRVTELRGQKIESYYISPEDFDITPSTPNNIAGGTAEENARIMLRILNGDEGPKRDITILNAAAAIYVSGLAESIQEGLEIAKNSIDTGEALEKVKALIAFSGGKDDLEFLEELS
ncbi:MAG: anthranilate phosphoribosyltransferase [Candidatus Hadarchaeota archaeon]